MFVELYNMSYNEMDDFIKSAAFIREKRSASSKIVIAFTSADLFSLLIFLPSS